MTGGTIALRLMFEWGGGSLWTANAAARAAFPDFMVDDLVALPPDLRAEMERLSVWHDTALDWDDPAGPSPWDANETARFDAAARDLRDRIAAYLGPGFEIAYDIADRDQAMLDAPADPGQSGDC